ncbi:hypothetical protein [Actinokineospora sp.]|uniref:hypothetical protein n=1 Tax=Actinokineospora sp. TaxID=1872133 RepID=UPI004037EAF7
MTEIRLTRHARGGGCACKLPPGETRPACTAAGRRADLGRPADRGEHAVIVR